MLPVLAAGGVTLRPITHADAAPMQAYCGEWDVVRMLASVPHPYPEGEAEAFIGEVLSGPAEELPFRIMVVDAGQGFAGLVALNAPSGFQAGGAADLGYWIGKPFWGRGLMTAALRLSLAGHAFGALGLSRVTSGMFEDNSASFRVQEKLGFQVVGEHMRHCVARGYAVRHIDTALTRLRFAEIAP